MCVPAFGSHGSDIHAPNEPLKLSFLKSRLHPIQRAYHVLYSAIGVKGYSYFWANVFGFGRPLIVKYIFPVAAILNIQNGHLTIICANANIDFWIQ